MKKFVLVLLSLAVAFNASAEGFGVVAGFTSSSMSIKDFDVKAATGYQFGVALNLPFGLGFSLQPELLYNVKATTFEAMTKTATVTGVDTQELANLAKMGYIEIPVQVQWGIDLSVVRPYVFAEPFVGFAVNGIIDESGANPSVNFDGLKDRLEYGFGIGAGIDLFSKFQISAKYYWNLDSEGGLSSMVSTVQSNVQEKAAFNGLVFSAAIFF